MNSIAEEPPVGPILAVAGLVVIGIAAWRTVVAETIGPMLIAALLPVLLTGGLLLVLGYRIHALSERTDRILLWTGVGAIAVTAAVGAILLRVHLLDVRLDPLLILLAVGSVGAAGAAGAAFIDTKRRDTLARYRQRVTELETRLADTSGVGLVSLTPAGEVDDWSAGAADILGYDAEGIRGEHLSTLYPDDNDDIRHPQLKPGQDTDDDTHEPSARHHLQQALRTDHVVLDGRLRRADDEWVPVTGTLTAAEDGETLVGYTLVVSARDHRGYTAPSHEREATPDDRSGHWGRQFERLAPIVDETLREPHATASEAVTNERTRNDSGRLDDAATALEEMADPLAEIHALAAAHRDADALERVALDSAVESAWEAADPMWARLETEELTAVNAVPERLERLLTELFENAVEHGGDVTVRVGMLPDGIYVADDGPGLEAPETVFEVGYTTDDGDGTGLGLPTVAAIAESHAWDVSAAESADGGARFEVRGMQTFGRAE
ncbi:sensor box histidine kinase [Natronomonas pharaonis DSM 2160]|uniref:histidine kinase n=1 Tax=Natronomonas pharaonis (strain ATCC 35678 / DSM 2160 / CIP 103997 / JCM 8858 / NBRC 14720 / NCIMB 2260 / Gabara) TaxID=348780 RepID=A0A1U7EX79_NATPD|nr:PAS domain-containing sensor histidine kinase [Natronomonas pharaonis]CAI49769.1 sensor box histidine kinase [Natronomonas pharaonis DSM 2160]